MEYFEKTGYNKDQNKKDITWKEVINLPVYVRTAAGNLWHGRQKVSEEATKKPCYIAETSSHRIALYFFEKASLGEKKGVKLHLTQRLFNVAKNSYDLALSEDYWVFITPDWKVYDMNGYPIKIKELSYKRSYAPSYDDFYRLKLNAHDLRLVGQFKEGGNGASFCEWMLSPATVEILKEVGFDMETRMESTWQFKAESRYPEREIPENVYLTEWFVDNLAHPNRVARREKDNSLIKHDYKYYHDLMGDKDFLIFEEEGQVYVAKQSYGSDHCGITVSYLKMPGRKIPFCVLYSEKGAKRLIAGSIADFLEPAYTYVVKPDEKILIIKDVNQDIIDQLLGERQLLEKTEVFKNLIPTLEKAKEDLNSILLKPFIKDFSIRMFNDLSYILSPVGQKDRVFEETIKQNGLGRGTKAKTFLRYIGDYTNPDLKQRTPYGQVGLTKSIYYKLRKMVDNGRTINFRAMIEGFVESERPLYLTAEEYKAKRLEFYSYLTPDFLDLLERKASVSFSYGSIDCDNFWSESETWKSLLRLAGKDLQSPLPEKIAAVMKLLKKDDLLGDSLSALFYRGGGEVLRDYYHQVKELAPLGFDWPQRYEDFSVKNITWFLGTIRKDLDLVNRAKYLILDASLGERVKILHELQNRISAENRLEIEKATLQQMDKQYAPWREQLRKALGWKGQDLGIFVPESLAELTEEGKNLSHCVGGYKEDVALRKEGILFLRKLSSPNKSYYTLDVVKGPDGRYTVRQCHGDCNCNPTPKVIEALRQWASDTKKVDESSIKSEYGALLQL